MMELPKKGVIFCVRTTKKARLTRREVDELSALEVKTPTCSIPCGNQYHEDCGGDGCECACHRAAV